MDTLVLQPLVEGYDFNVGNNVREQQLEGGMPRQVVNRVGAVHVTGVTLLLPDNGTRQYFWAFWRKNSQRIGQPSTAAPRFNWNLMLDNGMMEDCICQFVGTEQPKETFIGGYASKVQFTVYVVPISRDAEYDKSIVDLWGGVESTGFIELEKIPNEYFPNATGV